MNKYLHLPIDEKVIEKLNKVSIKTGKTKSKIVEESIKLYIKNNKNSE